MVASSDLLLGRGLERFADADGRSGERRGPGDIERAIDHAGDADAGALGEGLAGLSAGDVLTKFDGREVNTRARLTALVATKSPGDKVRIRWIDSFGAAHAATVELATGPRQ